MKFTVTRIPISTPPLYHVDGTLSRDGFSYRVTDGKSETEVERPASWRGAHVRVKYRFNKSERSVLSDAVVLAEFAEAEHLKTEPIAVMDREVRAPEVVNARTLADKLAAALKTPTLSAGLSDKLARLDRGDGPGLLSEIQQTLNPSTTPAGVHPDLLEHKASTLVVSYAPYPREGAKS